MAAVCSEAQSLKDIDRILAPFGGHIEAAVKKYRGTDLIETVAANDQQRLPKGWQLHIKTNRVLGQPAAMDLSATFILEQGQSAQTAVSIAVNFNRWSRNNYVLVPAILYNGNRYPSIGNGYNPDYPKEMYYNPKVPLTISNDPRLAIEKNRASVVELQTGNAATPAMCFFAPASGKSLVLLTDQCSQYGNHGLTITENKEQTQSSFIVTAPAMRQTAPGFGDFHRSGDKAPDWKAGDSLTLHLRLFVINTTGIPELLMFFMQHRKDITGKNQPRSWLPMSYYAGLATTITSNNFREFPAGSYYLPENSKDFQLGWVSGMMNTYPMLALNNKKERERVGRELDFVINKLQGKSGYFYGGITADGAIRPEKMNPAFPAVQAMVRKNSDALLWLIKHLLLFKAQGFQKMIKPEWEAAAQKLARAFVNTWEKNGQFGQYIVPETGEIAVFNSTAGAIAPAGLALASGYFHNPRFLKVAEASANYYYNRDVVQQGLTGGDCGDISMDANSESAFGFLESLMALYSYTGDKSWLKKAEVTAALAATWTLSYDAVFPPQSQIGKLGSHMAGAVWASIQNKHAAPGICTASGDYLFKLYRATSNPLYADLIGDIQHAQAEAVNIPPVHITTNNLTGSSMERIQPSDAEGKDAIGNFINTRNSWTETNGVLMALELPGIYAQTDTKKVQVFDHVEARIIKTGKAGVTLAITNKTKYTASVAIFAETSNQAQTPLSYTAFVNWPKVTIEPGKVTKVDIDNAGKLRPAF